MTDWTPDTCGCTLRVEEDWSKAIPLTKCPHHAHHADDEHFSAVLTENQMKNTVLSHIRDNIPSALGAPHPEDRHGWAAAYGVQAAIKFDDKRNLVIAGIPAEQQIALQGHLDKAHGAGKVKVL